MRTLDELSFHNLLSFIALTIFLYVVFVLQLLILLKSMDIGLSTSILMAGISGVFLRKTVIPAFNFLSDLGVREFSAVFFFSLYGISAPAVILPTLILWLINIFLPSLFGMYFIARLRLSKLRAQPI